jgi:hypothetical protein
MNASGVFVLNLVSTLYLVGLIWTIQSVHYELMDRVGVESFRRYEADHNRLITPIVGPAMLVEAGTAMMLALGMAPPWVPRWAAWVGVVAVAGIWLSTVCLQVPYHTRLLEGFDFDAYRRLVQTNWIRTVLWTFRGGLLTYLLWRALQTPAVGSLESGPPSL